MTLGDVGGAEVGLDTAAMQWRTHGMGVGQDTPFPAEP